MKAWLTVQDESWDRTLQGKPSLQSKAVSACRSAACDYFLRRALTIRSAPERSASALPAEPASISGIAVAIAKLDAPTINKAIPSNFICLSFEKNFNPLRQSSQLTSCGGIASPTARLTTTPARYRLNPHRSQAPEPRRRCRQPRAIANQNLQVSYPSFLRVPSRSSQAKPDATRPENTHHARSFSPLLD